MPNLWQTVSGKIEKDEESKEACQRETFEETGIKVSEDKMKLIFNDEYFNCDVYITQIHPSQRPKRMEPTKMSGWKTINREQYIKLARSKLMTSTHVRKHEEILKCMQRNGTWSNWGWGDDVDPIDDLKLYNKTQ